MLSSFLTQSLILITFSILLKDYLTSSTAIITILGSILKIFQIKVSKWGINSFAIILLISFWLSFNKIFDPEVGLNFLISVIVLKFLEADSKRDDYMIFFGLILLISSGALFEKTLVYTIYFTFSFFLLIKQFYRGLEIRFKIKEIVMTISFIFPLAGVLFILFPRALSPVDLGHHSAKEGEIGHNPNVEISKFSSLTPSRSFAFTAEISQSSKLPNLYWRGNTVSYNTGWDWSVGIIDHPEMTASSIKKSEDHKEALLNQKIKISFPSQYLFSLGGPRFIKFRQSFYSLPKRSTPFFLKHQSPKQYEVWSNPNVPFIEDKIPREFIRSALTREEKRWVQQTFHETRPRELINEVRKYFVQSQFSYSLNPGEISSFLSFMTDKKVGVCSHYSSALGLILREKKIPTRLVSGFLGGELNPYGLFYEIYQNDAHVWVEYAEDGLWKMVDPTLWIAPSRIELSSHEFLENLRKSNNFISQINFPFSKEIRILKQKFSNWDYQFYQWIENLDYWEQERIFKFFKIERRVVFILLPLVVLIFAFLFFITSKKKINKSDFLWGQFFKNLNKHYPDLEGFHFSFIKDHLHQSGEPKAQMLLKLMEELEEFSFNSKGEFYSLKNKLKKVI
jgi:transglutaminase-like putative cysteine protease